MIMTDGGPAFPSGMVKKTRPLHDPGSDFRVTDIINPSNEGMSLRDYFAAKVLAGYMATEYPYLGMQKVSIEENDIAIAQHCYAIADAMLAEREKRRE